jgi:hypothetical protein
MGLKVDGPKTALGGTMVIAANVSVKSAKAAMIYPPDSEPPEIGCSGAGGQCFLIQRSSHLPRVPKTLNQPATAIGLGVSLHP